MIAGFERGHARRAGGTVPSRDARCSRRTFAAGAAALALVLLLSALAQARPSLGSWSDDFSSTRRLASTGGARVAGGALKLAEGQPVDLGEAVPGESEVLSLVAVGDDVFCGTGPVGHLVHYDADRLFQEGHSGPSHYGVSSSRGQVSSGGPAKTTALVTGSGKVFGGTEAGGVFSLDFSEDGNRPEEHGQCPGASGGVTGGAWCSGKAYFGTGHGFVFSCDGSGTLVSVGQVAGATAVTSMAAAGGSLFAGLANGHVYEYSGGLFSDIGSPDGSPVNALLVSGATLYAGLESGSVCSYDTGAPGPFALRGAPAGGTAVLALAENSGVVYAGSVDGHLYSGPDAWVDEGAPANSGGAPIDALAVSSGGVLYGGTGEGDAGSYGRLFRCAPGAFEDFDRPPGSGDLSGVAFYGRVLYAARGERLYKFASPGTYEDLGAPSPGRAIRDIEARSGTVYAALDDGSCWAYAAWEPDPEPEWRCLGTADPPSRANRVVHPVWDPEHPVPLCVGLEDGRLLKGNDMSGPELASIGSPIRDIFYKSEEAGAPAGLYIAAGDGRLWYFVQGTLRDLGLQNDNTTAANAVASSGGRVFIGHENGLVHSYDGSGFTQLGAADSAVTSMAPGSQGVALGTADGRLYIQEESEALRDEGTVPHAGAVLALCHTGTSVWAGSSGGFLASRDDSHLGDLGPLVERQIMVWCMTYDPGRDVFYAGTYTSAHFLVIDPATDTVTDLGRPIPGERELEDIIVTREGEVVGCTYGGTESAFNPDGGHIFTYSPSPGNPARGDFTDRGKAPPPDNNWWISSLVDGPPSKNLVYGATSNSAVDETHREGRIFSLDKTTWTATDLGAPVPGEGIRSLAPWYADPGHPGRDDVIFGGTWQPSEDDRSHVFKHTVDGGSEVIGEAPTPPGSFNANRHVNRVLVQQDTVYAAQNNGFLFSFEAGSTTWDPEVLGRPVESSTAVYPLAAGPFGTVLCGTNGGPVTDPAAGHLVSRDASLGAYRDIDVSAVMSAALQERVASIAVGGAGVRGVTMCGTMGMRSSAVTRRAAHVFKVPAYRTGGAQVALSTVVDPALEELAAAFTGQAGIGALCRAPGAAEQVYVGTAGTGGNARLYRFDSMTETLSGGPWEVGAERVASLCPGPDGKVYIGTASGPAGPDAQLKRFDPLTGAVTALEDGGLLRDCKGIHAMVAGPDGRVYAGAGDRGAAQGKLMAFDPRTGALADLGTLLPGPGRVNGLAVSGSKVVAVTGTTEGATGTARCYSYTPGGSLVSEGVIGDESTTAGLVAGPGGALYCGTGPSGGLYMRGPGGGFFQVAGWPASLSGKAVTALAAGGDRVYGCAGETGELFEYAPGGGFTVHGSITTDNSGVPAGAADGLGRLFFGTAGSGGDSSVRLLRYNPAAAFTWLTAGADTAAPAGTSVLTALRDVTDAVDVKPGPLGSIGSPTSIEDVENRALRFKATLETSDAGATPEVTAWEATWRVDAAIDRFVYPYAEGAYPGDTLRIWGTGFGASGTATVGGLPAEAGIWQPGFVSLTIPAGAGAGEVEISPGGGGGSAVSSFNLLSPPAVTIVSPSRARVGDYVDIHGTGFLDSRGGEESVSFNGSPATDFASWSDTLIRVRVPRGATSGPLSVSVNHHASNQVPFTVDEGGGPLVKVTAPEDGAAVKGIVRIEANVRRNGGDDPVELWVDGARKAEDPTAPFVFKWDSDTAADGAHRLTVKAVDGYGRSASDSVTVYVDHTVPGESTDWYFAEGCTDYGFETWVLIGNPSSGAAIAHVTFMDSGGETYRLACDVRPNSRLTVNAADVAPGKNVSVQVSADKPVVCERAMYWAGRIEGHDTIGSTGLSREWYFAEGSTDWGFETFTLLCNPGSSPVRATLDYMFDDGTIVSRAHELAPHSRLTVNAAEEVGARDFSVRVRAGAPGIVAERSMYHGNRRCGTNTIGCKEPSLTWYLSEGSTDWGFETWLLIQRPAGGDARVSVSYRLGTGRTVRKVYDVKGGSRFTVDLLGEVGVADVSTQVTSDVPVVCERSMYWNSRSAGHCTVGSPGLGRSWFLAEGCTDFGFETWILLDNPSTEAVFASVTFLKEDGTAVPVAVKLEPESRCSLDASTRVGACSFSTRIESPSPIMVERAMYWGGRTGGTGSVGAR